MFYTIEELVQQADRNYQGNIAELMIATETELTGRERPEILALMARNLEVMKESVQAGLSPEKSPTGLTGGDAAKLDAYIKNGKTLADSAVLGAARNAMAVNESNAKMGFCLLYTSCAVDKISPDTKVTPKRAIAFFIKKSPYSSNSLIIP